MSHKVKIQCPCGCDKEITVAVEFDRADPSIGMFHDSAWCETDHCPLTKKIFSLTEQEIADERVVDTLDASDYYTGPDTTAEHEGWV